MPAADYELSIKLPDPNSSVFRERRQGSIEAVREGEPVGHLWYGLGPGQAVQLISIEVAEPWKRDGCGTAMVELLSQTYTDLEVQDGGNTNTDEGDAFLARQRRDGLVSPADI